MYQPKLEKHMEGTANMVKCCRCKENDIIELHSKKTNDKVFCILCLNCLRDKEKISKVKGKYFVKE